MQHSYRQFSEGLTLIEMIVALVLTSTVLFTMITIIYSTATDSNFQQRRESLDSDTQLVADVLERDIRVVTSFNNALPAGYTDFFGYSPTRGGSAYTWSINGDPVDSTKRALITESAATTQSSMSSTRSNIYTTANDVITCGGQYETLKPRHKYYNIYFLRSNTLYKRYITNTTAAVCNGVNTSTTAGLVQAQKQTCPAGVTSSECLAADEILATNVSKFFVEYSSVSQASGLLDTSNYTLPSATALNAYGSPATPVRDAELAKITIERSVSYAGKTLTSSRNIYSSRLNK